MQRDSKTGILGLARLFYSIITHEYFFYAIIAAISIGTFYARAAVSIATLSLGIIALLTVVQPGKLRKLFESKETVALTTVLFVFILSGLNSSNNEVWLSRVGDNIPFLAIPAGIWVYCPLKRRQVLIAVSIFVLATTFSSLLVIGSYLLHLQEYNELYKVGKTIPTPIIHVRYSYFLALAAVCSIGLVMDRSSDGPGWRKVLLALGIWLIVCVHILAVRTGMFALYGGLLTLGIAYAIKARKWKPLIISLVLISGLAAGSVWLLPSVGNKVQYMMHDLKMLRTKGVSPEYSDNLRLISIIHGMELFIDHPVVGVGIGDVEDEMEELYNKRTPMIPPDRRFPPISQYVFWLSGLGLLGTSVLVGLVAYPLVTSGWRSFLLIGVYGLTAFSFLAETTIQLQLGKTIFILLVSVIAVGLVNREMMENRSLD